MEASQLPSRCLGGKRNGLNCPLHRTELQSKGVNAKAKVTHSYINYDLDEKHASDFFQLTLGMFFYFSNFTWENVFDTPLFEYVGYFSP